MVLLEEKKLQAGRVAMLLKSNLQLLFSPCTEPSERVHNWRNVKSE